MQPATTLTAWTGGAEDILPDYYTHDMLGIQSDAQTLTALLEAQLPDLLLHMVRPAQLSLSLRGALCTLTFACSG